MSWGDYGIPSTMNARSWINALTDATNERHMRGSGRWEDVESPNRLSSRSEFKKWADEIMANVVGRGDYVNLNDFNPLDYTGKNLYEIVPIWESRDQLLEYFGESDYDINGHHLYPKYDRNFFDQQYRMLNELTAVFPTISPYNSFYGGTIRKRILPSIANGSTIKDALRNANRSPDSYENAYWFGYSQPVTNVSSSYVLENDGNYEAQLQFSQIVVDVVWTIEAEISVWFYAKMGGWLNSRWSNVPPFVRNARLVNGHAEIETLTQDIFSALIDDLREGETTIFVQALGCIFNFKTENGFQLC